MYLEKFVLQSCSVLEILLARNSLERNIFLGKTGQILSNGYIVGNLGFSRRLLWEMCNGM